MVKVAVLASAVVLLLLGCRSGAGDSPPVASTPASADNPTSVAATGTPIPASGAGKPVEFRPARPVNVTTEIDSETAATRMVGPDGGKLEAIATDGTRYSLSFPPDVMLHDTLITISPIISATGGPLAEGGTPYGFRIEPDDAPLFGVATLQIIPVRPVGAVAALSADSGGGNVHFDLIDLRIDSILLPITHFSEHLIVEIGEITEVTDSGTVEVTVGEITEVGDGPVKSDGESVDVTVGEITEVGDGDSPGSSAALTPEGAAEQLANEIGKLLAKERVRQLNGEPPDPELHEKLMQLADEFYRVVIEPGIGLWATDCDKARAEVDTAWQWVRSMVLLGGDESDPRIARIQEETVRAIKNCIDELAEPCLETSDIGDYLGFMRQLALLSDGPEYLEQDIYELLCGDLSGHITITRVLDYHDYYDLTGKEVFDIVVSVANPVIGNVGGYLPEQVDSSTISVQAEMVTEQTYTEGPCSGKVARDVETWSDSGYGIPYGTVVLTGEPGDPGHMWVLDAGTQSHAKSRGSNQYWNYVTEDLCSGYYGTWEDSTLWNIPPRYDGDEPQGTVSEDRMSVTIFRELKFETYTETMTGVLYLSKPLPVWN